MSADIRAVRALLPHRYPMLMLDKILELHPGQSIKAIKNVTINEEFFQGHFPGYPIMPGALIVEAMAQAAGVLAMSALDEPDKESYCFLTSIDKAKFKSPVAPGDTLLIEAWPKRQRKNFFSMEARARVQSNKAASAILGFALARPPSAGGAANDGR